MYYMVEYNLEEKHIEDVLTVTHHANLEEALTVAHQRCAQRFEGCEPEHYPGPLVWTQVSPTCYRTSYAILEIQIDKVNV